MKKTYLLVILTLCLGLILGQPGLAAADLKDINGHWAQVHIEKWTTDGLIAGYPDGKFKPDDPITRAEFVSLVNRAYKIERSDTLYQFPDVKSSDWFFAQVMSGKEAGYIAGYPDGSFKPNHHISRQEAAVLITKLLSLSSEQQTSLTSFTDHLSIDKWAQSSINAVLNNGIMSGFPDKTFKAQQNISRAEAVVTLERSLDYPKEGFLGLKGIVKLDTHPVAGASVKIFAGDSQEPLNTTITDDNGQFSFTVPNGVYQITALHNKQVGYTGHITVNSAMIAREQEIELAQGVRVSGTLLDNRGKALANLPLVFTTNPSFGENSNEKGEFSVILPMTGNDGKALFYTGYYVYQGSLKVFAPNQHFTGDTDLGQISTNVPGKVSSGGGGGNDKDQPADTTPPSLISAAVNGSTLVVIFNENLDQASLPLGVNFGVMVNDSEQERPVNVTIADDKVIITLATAINHGDKITIKYTPGANPIQDLAGNQAAGFAGQPVVNNTSETGDTVAPALDRTVATNLFAATEFLYSGDNPVQTGMEPDTIQQNRAAVIRGLVFDRDGAPLTGVRITVLNHPEFGSTVSRLDGYFDMAVNGGGQMTVRYEKEGYITAQRQVDVPWQDFAILPDVIIIPYDSNKTDVDLTLDTMQVAQGSEITDADGTRQATLVIPAGVSARLDDGTPISNLTIRATEYTVGANGPEAMPAVLPPNVGYTYCVEYSADEAVAVGSKSVIFDQPIYHYVENFIGFPVGGIVPMGYYDYDQAAWIPSKNGRVIKIISINGDGLAELDIDGQGLANAEALATLNVTDSERQKLAGLYEVGQELWRVPITHFTPWDCNWPYGPPPGARGPQVPMPEIKMVNDPCKGRGSIIEYQNQALGEAATVYGTSFSLNYNSNRVEGNKQIRSIEIPISGADLPEGLEEIRLVVQVAGQYFSKIFEPVVNQNYTYTWDGKNAYGQTFQGSTPVYVSIGYVYKAIYQNPPPTENVFGGYGIEQFEWVPSRGGLTVTAWQRWTGTLSYWDSLPAGIGGWSLDVHHAYVPNSGVLYMGDGSRIDAGVSQNIISTVAGSALVDADEDGYLDGSYSGDNGLASMAQLNRPFDVAVGPDGSLFIADGWNNRIRKIDTEGIITTIAGNPIGNELDNGPAKMIKIGAPLSIALGPDGSVYFAENARHRIRRVDPDGFISVVAGTGLHGLSGDGGLASEAQLNNPGDLTVAADGSIYIADTNNHRIRRIDPNGYISTIAGIGTGTDGGGYGGDGDFAIKAKLTYPKAVAIGPDGSLYIADSGNNCIRRVGINGIITTVLFSSNLNRPSNIAVTPDGTLLITETANQRIRQVTLDGVITTVAGNGTQGYSGDGDTATEAQLNNPGGIALSPDGSIYFADIENHRIRRVGQPFQGNLANEYLIADQAGSKLFVFDQNGRHQRTINALTGSEIYTFAYNPQGQLIAVADVFGNLTTLERDVNGKPTEIIAPGGQKTYLAVNENGYLASISCPYEIPIDLEYTNENLLTIFSDHKGNVHRFSYDEMGRLTKDEDPVGGYTQLSRTQLDNGYEVMVNTAEGRESIYKVEYVPGVGTRRVDTDASGGVTISEINNNGTRKVTYPDGTMVTMVNGPDPRPGIGMQEPIIREFTITTPGGLTSRITRERSLEFADEDTSKLFNIRKITDTVNNNGKIHTTTYDLDTTKQKIIVTDVTPGGRQRVNTLDWYGRITEAATVGLESTNYSYDGQGRLSSVQQGAQHISYTYDAMNRLIGLEDAGGASFKYTYNDADVLTSITMPGGQSYAFGNDYNGNVTAITMPGGAVHELGYTSIDQPESYTPPGNPPYLKSYDKDRALTQMELPDGRAVNYSYDEGGRITGMEYDEARSIFGFIDATDRISSIMRDPDGDGSIYSYGYDGALITQMSVSTSSELIGNYSYRYDNDFKLIGLTLDGATELNLAYDNDGLLTQYGEFTIEHAGPLGAPSQISGGAMTTTYTYDTNGRLTKRCHTVGGQTVYSLDIIYDNTGIIKTRTEQVGDSAPIVYNYTYDTNKQLTGVTRDGISNESYTYDSNGNRQSGDATYDIQDRLTMMDGIEYQFNDDGFLALRGSDDTFNYTAQGELRQAMVGDKDISYTYDGLGRRVGRSINTGTLIEKEQYLYGNLGNPYQITALLDGAGKLSQYYYDQNNFLFAIKQGDTWYYVATDQQGTPRIVSNADGTSVKVMEYNSYGKIISDSNPTFQLPVGYAGGINDPATGLVHFGMRDYDPDTGRWTARDPILFDGRQGNLYVYVGNNPVNLRDPSGLFCIGGSAYAGFGGGGQFCVTGEGVSLCAEVGFGVGTSVEVNPFQGLAENSSEVGIQMGIGPASGELTLDDCGNLKFTGGLGVGPFSKSASYDFLDGKWSGNDISVGIDPTDFLGSDDKSSKSKIEVNAKIYGKKCMKI